MYAHRGYNVDFEIARGYVPGQLSVLKYGRATEVNVEATDIYDRANPTDTQPIWLGPTASVVHEVTSDDIDDDVGGDGLLTLGVWGLTDWATKEIYQEIIMTGAVAAPTAPLVMINRMKGLTWGSLGPNVGTVKATAVGGGGKVTSQINAMEGQTQQAIYGIPSGQTLYLYNYYAGFSGSNTTSWASIRLLYNPIPDVQPLGFLQKHTKPVRAAGSSDVDRNFRLPYAFTGPGILKMQAFGGAAGLDITADMDFVLVDGK
jgi:hypothetical protein